MAAACISSRDVLANDDDWPEPRLFFPGHLKRDVNDRRRLLLPSDLRGASGSSVLLRGGETADFPGSPPRGGECGGDFFCVTAFFGLITGGGDGVASSSPVACAFTSVGVSGGIVSAG